MLGEETSFVPSFLDGNYIPFVPVRREGFRINRETKNVHKRFDQRLPTNFHHTSRNFIPARALFTSNELIRAASLASSKSRNSNLVVVSKISGDFNYSIQEYFLEISRVFY